MPERSQEIVDALMATGKPVSYINVDAPHGHDSFLFDIPRYMGAVKGFYDRAIYCQSFESQKEHAHENRSSIGRALDSAALRMCWI